MPIPEVIRDFMGDLLGKAVSVAKRKPVDFVAVDPAADDVFVTGRYLDDTGRLAGACVSDLALATSVGAALAMISPEVAKESVKAGALNESLRENYYEVLNIMSALLNGPSVRHLKLDDVVDGVPQDVADLIAVASGLKYYDVTIVGYTGGRLGLIGS
jgi:hypothetical protein